MERMPLVFACGTKQEGLKIKLVFKAILTNGRDCLKQTEGKPERCSETGKNNQQYKYKPSPGGDMGIMVGYSRA